MKMKTVFFKIFIISLLTLNLSFFMTNSQARVTANSENLLFIDLKYGQVVIELLPHVAPKHVERIKVLAARGFYDNIKFHRVIQGFMAQTGDPTGTGTGGSDLFDLRAEFSDERNPAHSNASLNTFQPIIWSG